MRNVPRPGVWLLRLRGCAPADVPEAPLDGEANPGRYETLTQGGFTDDYIYNSSDSFKIGTRREWGGTIVFLAKTMANPDEKQHERHRCE
ncbi:MAG: hypothetical protein R3E66_14215 [bacterium]